MPRGLALDWTRASLLRDWRLPSTAMEMLATSESGHFSNRDVGIANGWRVWNSNLSVSARDFLFSTTIQSAPGPAQPPVLPQPGVGRSGHDFYYSLHLAQRVSTVRAIVLFLLCVFNGMLRSYLYSLTPEYVLKKALSIEPTCFCKTEIQPSYSMCASVANKCYIIAQ